MVMGAGIPGERAIARLFNHNVKKHGAGTERGGWPDDRFEIAMSNQESRNRDWGGDRTERGRFGRFDQTGVQSAEAEPPDPSADRRRGAAGGGSHLGHHVVLFIGNNASRSFPWAPRPFILARPGHGGFARRGRPGAYARAPPRGRARCLFRGDRDAPRGARAAEARLGGRARAGARAFAAPVSSAVARLADARVRRDGPRAPAEELRGGAGGASSSRRVLGVDYGRTRTGLAVSSDGLAPRPLGVVPSQPPADLLRVVVEAARRERAGEIVVGLPVPPAASTRSGRGPGASEREPGARTPAVVDVAATLIGAAEAAEAAEAAPADAARRRRGGVGDGV